MSRDLSIFVMDDLSRIFKKKLSSTVLQSRTNRNTVFKDSEWPLLDTCDLLKVNDTRMKNLSF